jgi:hypothetical protein
MKRIFLFPLLAISIFCITGLFIYAIDEPEEDVAYQRLFNTSYNVLSVKLPKELDFADEPVPLYDSDVREGLEKELLVNTYWQSQTLLLIKRANRYFPQIEPILKRNGIPDDFKYLPLIESGFTYVVSPAGAAGFWHILEATAKENDLEVNEEVDERYNLEKSTQAACDYFKKAYSVFGNWTIVAASYNMGISGISKQIERQKTSNYYGLLLNEETARYVFRILAIKEIISYPRNYGYYLRQKDLYQPAPYIEITVDSSISDLANFALAQNISYKTLKKFNPWLRNNTLTNKLKKKYQIALPQPTTSNTKKERIDSVLLNEK